MQTLHTENNSTDVKMTLHQVTILHSLITQHNLDHHKIHNLHFAHNTHTHTAHTQFILVYKKFPCGSASSSRYSGNRNKFLTQTSPCFLVILWFDNSSCKSESSEVIFVAGPVKALLLTVFLLYRFGEGQVWQQNRDVWGTH